MAEQTYLDGLRVKHDVKMSNAQKARLIGQGAALGFGDEIEALVRAMSPNVTIFILFIVISALLPG